MKDFQPHAQNDFLQAVCCGVRAHVGLLGSRQPVGGPSLPGGSWRARHLAYLRCCVSGGQAGRFLCKAWHRAHLEQVFAGRHHLARIQAQPCGPGAGGCKDHCTGVRGGHRHHLPRLQSGPTLRRRQAPGHSHRVRHGHLRCGGGHGHCFPVAYQRKGCRAPRRGQGGGRGHRCDSWHAVHACRHRRGASARHEHHTVRRHGGRFTS